MLYGLPATTHGENIDELGRSFPFLSRGPGRALRRSGQGTYLGWVCCGIDPCLHIVRSDVSAAAANQIARRLVGRPVAMAAKPSTCPQWCLPPESLRTPAGALERVEQPLSHAEHTRHAGMLSVPLCAGS